MSQWFIELDQNCCLRTVGHYLSLSGNLLLFTIMNLFCIFCRWCWYLIVCLHGWPGLFSNFVLPGSFSVLLPVWRKLFSILFPGESCCWDLAMTSLCHHVWAASCIILMPTHSSCVLLVRLSTSLNHFAISKEQKWNKCCWAWKIKMEKESQSTGNSTGSTRLMRSASCSIPYNYLYCRRKLWMWLESIEQVGIKSTVWILLPDRLYTALGQAKMQNQNVHKFPILLNSTASVILELITDLQSVLNMSPVILYWVCLQCIIDTIICVKVLQYKQDELKFTAVIFI